MEQLNADYLIIGSGAMGMAFADILLSESDASMIIVDSYAKPGGHWNAAYPFVQLHQPSAYYGVSSKELSGGRLERAGLNVGLGELAGGADISAYYDDVMRHQFLPSGRVQYYPMCNYTGQGTFTSKANGKTYHATANNKTVDATFLKTSVPSTHTPGFDIAEGVRFMPLNDLPRVQQTPDGYVVIGAGKTGIDACLWLLEQRVAPEMITWIVSREAWLLDRRNTQMTQEFFFDTMETQARMLEEIANSSTPEDMFVKLESCGYFLRVDETVEPEMFHAATVSKLEIEALRQIKNVVRLGHVTAIGPNEIQLVEGSIPTTPNTIHVDCSASALLDKGSKPVFQDHIITLQMARPYQPVFSAALTAHVELSYRDDEEKNRLCGVVPLPNTTTDFIRFTAAGLINQYHWSQDKALQEWMLGNRLDGASSLIKSIPEKDTEKWAVVRRIRENAPKAAAKLFEFQETLGA